jgi:hypothetical protein
MTQLTLDELTGESVELLPRRETLALVNVTNITAVNIAIAVNAATIGSRAVAIAHQTVAAARL